MASVIKWKCCQKITRHRNTPPVIIGTTFFSFFFQIVQSGPLSIDEFSLQLATAYTLIVVKGYSTVFFSRLCNQFSGSTNARNLPVQAMSCGIFNYLNHELVVLKFP